jgi:stress response protein SCP2
MEDTVDLGEYSSLRLDQVNPSTTFICFVINSYNGKNIDTSLSKYEFTLHDENTKTVITDYKYSKTDCIGKHSAILMCCLYRCNQASKSNWMLRTLVQATPGIITNQVVDVLQNVIHQTILPTSFPSQRVPTKHSSGPRAALVVDC